MSSRDLEVMVGDQIRSARLAQELSQSATAEKANVSLTAMRKLETGEGSTLRTLVKVVRALDLDEWLNNLYQVPSTSPMQLLRESQNQSPRRRAPRRAGS